MIKQIFGSFGYLFGKWRESEQPQDPDASLIRFWDEDAGDSAYQIVLTDINTLSRSYRKVIETNVRIGFSNEMDICVNHDRSVSRTHCEILREGDLFYIVNHSRSNGTYLNQQIVLDKTPIASGDIITMGRVELCMEIDG